MNKEATPQGEWGKAVGKRLAGCAKKSTFLLGPQSWKIFSFPLAFADQSGNMLR